MEVKSLRRVRLFTTPWTGSAVHGISQARALEWGAIAFSVSQVKLCQNDLVTDVCFKKGGQGKREHGCTDSPREPRPVQSTDSGCVELGESFLSFGLSVLIPGALFEPDR